ncbi:hypothetical protein WUBG_16296 [Wuchereria bancrofti]|uniref:SET domain-containing protein n=1 Tax=Wuchereria bancrofti TaxID=6293 RepID=J9E729_WUCBA|nr:hypothetical protein WUBG_16296 [Wuchereria bancrofti]
MELPSLYTIDAKKKGNIGRFFNHSVNRTFVPSWYMLTPMIFVYLGLHFFTTTKISAGSEKNELAAADLDYARSSLVMVEPDVFTSGTKLDSDDMPAVEPAGPPEGRFDMLKYVENMELPSLYTIDAKKKGNIGRFFNHSCQPNIRSQLVYVDTHDFRLPWIAFFTTTKISAGSVC